MHGMLAMLGAAILLAASPVSAEDIDQDMLEGGGEGCVYDRQVYTPGSELCQNGSLMRCDQGAWDDVGVCQGGAGQAPISGGGDEDESGD